MAAPIPSNESDRLAAVRRLELLDTPPEPAFDRLTQLASKLMGAPIALISLIDDRRQWSKSRIGVAFTEIARAHSICAHAIAGEGVFIVCDASKDSRFRDCPLVAGDPHVRFYAGVPLRTADGLAVGTLSILDVRPRSGLSPEEAEVLRDLAALAMALVEERPPAIGSASQRSASLLRDIGAALADEGQLHLVYQPKTDLRSGRCVGAEALLRWNHPTLGAVPPSEFVPLVEGTPLVHAMTDWVLAAAFRQVAGWRAAALELPVAVNVSMSDLADDHFPARLAALLDRFETRPDWIDIEVTESAVAKDMGQVRRQLDAIRRLGMAIVIDDFGTGQAALSYLKYIPATEVKIDQLFISRVAVDRADQIMVRSTIDLVHALGCRVVAEGIEDAAALRWLREHDCDIGQGNAISPPLDARHFEQWLRSPPGPDRPELV